MRKLIVRRPNESECRRESLAGKDTLIIWKDESGWFRATITEPIESDSLFWCGSGYDADGLTAENARDLAIHIWSNDVDEQVP